MTYIITVFWFTVLRRSVTIQAAQFEVLWSYKKWITGNSDLGGEIVSNIVMFVPFGFLLSESLSSAYSKPSYFSIRRLL